MLAARTASSVLNASRQPGNVASYVVRARAYGPDLGLLPRFGDWLVVPAGARESVRCDLRGELECARGGGDAVPPLGHLALPPRDELRQAVTSDRRRHRPAGTPDQRDLALGVVGAAHMQ